MSDGAASESSRMDDDWSGDGGMLIFSQSRAASLRTFHPAVSQIFLLWQTFLDNVNPIIKPFHAPSVQQLILEAVGDMDNIPRTTDALLFAIYLSSVMSMDDWTCQRMLGEVKSDLVLRFSKLAEQALVNAEFLKSTNIVTLQAQTIYLVGLSSR